MSSLKIQGFKPEENTESINVLRFMPLSRFLSLLELQAMWFSRLGALQDQYECTDPKGARGFLLKAMKENPSLKDSQTPLGVPFKDLLKISDNGNSGDGFRQGGLVSCWFIGKIETEKMWTNYGDNGKGVAVRSTIKKLATSFQIPDDFAKASQVGRIQYVDFETCDLGVFGHDQARVSLIKDKTQFKDENEVRIVTLNFPHSGTVLPDGSLPSGTAFSPEIKGLHIKCNLRELIQSVIVGPNTDWNFHMLIKRIIGRFGLTLNVERSQLPPWASTA
jgi:hypothetical protein